LNLVVTTKIFPAVKITGATHDAYVPTNPTADDAAFPDRCTSLTSKMHSLTDIEPTPLSPISQEDHVELLNNELEFDEFLLDAAEWL